MKLQLQSEHPRALSDLDFDRLFSNDKPIICTHHGYPMLIGHKQYIKKYGQDSPEIRIWKWGTSHLPQ